MNFVNASKELLSPDTDILNNHAIVCFKGKEYPLLIFQFFFKNRNSQITSLDVSLIGFEQLVAQLEMSFLGQRVIFWLGDCSTVEKKDKQKLLTYLAVYSGPHTVLFFIDTTTLFSGSDLALTIEIPDSATPEIIEVCAELVSIEHAQRIIPFMRTIEHATKQMNVEQIIIILQYALLLGKRTDDFMNAWLPKIVLHETSLFTLSQHFFARNQKAFFSAWVKIADNYPEQFWIVFWSEQIWRAYYFLKLRSKSAAQAKKISYRLPFSFIQRDWAMVDQQELKNAHQSLYDIDCAIKNSAGFGQFDLFFTKFFERQF